MYILRGLSLWNHALAPISVFYPAIQLIPVRRALQDRNRSSINSGLRHKSKSPLKSIMDLSKFHELSYNVFWQFSRLLRLVSAFQEICEALERENEILRNRESELLLQNRFLRALLVGQMSNSYVDHIDLSTQSDGAPTEVLSDGYCYEGMVHGGEEYSGEYELPDRLET
ncbi:hypothetical protein EYR41_006114 [Orbilia oligospora]|uniref:Uncharacterized protein n=1 Tax=Orbilia oligospora TaxID=2813651 RepID=A0A8H2E2B7_ORBOL|nr:hypothetical protein EYR41_006114 [Orbilia oligospora]